MRKCLLAQALPELAPSQEYALRELHDRYLTLQLDSQALSAIHPGEQHPLHYLVYEALALRHGMHAWCIPYCRSMLLWAILHRATVAACMHVSWPA